MAGSTFSVVIPTCDRPIYLKDCIKSVLAQTLPAFEILIIDNGRKPIDPELLPSENNVQLIRALPRFGVSQARNLGVILSAGDYIAFLDDDDRWDSNYLSEIYRTIKKTGAQIILGRLRDLETGLPIEGKQANFKDREELVRQILLRNPGTGGSNTVVDRITILGGPGYDPWITTGQDKAFVLDLLLSGFMPARADEGWVDFRKNSEGSRQTELTKHTQGKWRFLRKYWTNMDWSARLFNLKQIGQLYIRRVRKRL